MDGQKNGAFTILRCSNSGKHRQGHRIWQLNLGKKMCGQKKSNHIKDFVLSNCLSHIFLPIHLFAPGYDALADIDRAKNVWAKNQTISKTLFFQIAFPIFFCPSIFLPCSPRSPIRLNVTHPDTMFTHKIDSNVVFVRNR